MSEQADKLARTQNQETRGHLHEVRPELKSVQALASTNSLEQSTAACVPTTK